MQTGRLHARAKGRQRLFSVLQSETRFPSPQAPRTPFPVQLSLFPVLLCVQGPCVFLHRGSSTHSPPCPERVCWLYRASERSFRGHTHPNGSVGLPWMIFLNQPSERCTWDISSLTAANTDAANAPVSELEYQERVPERDLGKGVCACIVT